MPSEPLILLEREAQLDSVLALARRAAGGQGGLVIVGGEAGIGKTSLLREFGRQVSANAKVMWGGCEDFFTPRPLGPLHDMAQDMDPRVAALLKNGGSQERIFSALITCLQESRDSIVMVFEDVHWADTATLDLIKYLGRRVGLLRTLLVLSLRSDEVSANHPLSSVLGDLPAATTARINLQPLTPDGVASLAQRAGHSGADLHRITGGNPFFVTELLANGVGGHIPESVRDAVWSRLSRLTNDERQLLDMMSVVPGSVEPWLMAALLGHGMDAAVDACVARGMVLRDAPGNLRFRHELARQATLARLTPSQQKLLHVRVEAAMAASPALVTLSRRVHHAAGAGDGAKVLALAPLAAVQAARLGAHQQAAAHLATALGHVDRAPRELAAQLHEDWAYEAGLALQIDASIIAARQSAIALWRELGRTDKVGLNLRWLSRLHWYRGEAQLAQDFMDQAVAELETLPEGPELAMAYSARSQMHMLHDRMDEAIAWGLRAIALAEKLGETETLVHALNNVGSALLFSGRSGGRERMEESLALALKNGFHEQAARAYTNFAESAVLLRDFPLAERLLSEGIAFDTKHGLDSWTYYLVGRQAQLRMEQGRLREAETIAQGVLNLKRLTLVMHLPALTVLGKVRVRLGEADGEALLRQALTDALATAEPQNITPVRFGLIEAAWLKQDMDACHDQLAQFSGLNFSGFDPWELGDLGVWWRRCGMAGPMPAGMERCAGPRAAELSGDFDAAAAAWISLGLPYEAALALTGSRSGAALSRAVVLFDEMEASPAARLVRKLAKSLGVADQLPRQRRGPYAAARSHPLGLTAREAQVLGLIAQGRSNLDIASQLARSPRTIEHQVSSLLGKFNATSRMDVVLRLHSEPWLLPEEKIEI